MLTLDRLLLISFCYDKFLCSLYCITCYPPPLLCIPPPAFKYPVFIRTEKYIAQGLTTRFLRRRRVGQFFGESNWNIIGNFALPLLHKLVPRAFYLPRRRKWPLPCPVSSATWLDSRQAKLIRVPIIHSM